MSSSRFLSSDEEKTHEHIYLDIAHQVGCMEPEDLWRSSCVRSSMMRWEGGYPIATKLVEFNVLMKALDQLAVKWRQLARLECLEREILLLKYRCANLERTTPTLVAVESFAPEPYEVIKPFHVVVKFYEDQYIASFFDANLSASGGTQEEAVFNLKDMLIDAFDILNEVEDDKLGPGPQQQKAVLKEFLARRTNGGNNERAS